VIMYVESFKTDAIVFIGKVINEFDIALTANFQYESRFADTGNVTLLDQRKNVQLLQSRIS